MSEYVTKTELAEVLDKKLKQQTDEIMSVVLAFMEQVDSRFTKQEAETFAIRADIKTIKHEVSDLKRSLDNLTNTVDGFVKRLDEESLENKMRDRQFERLLEWAHKVSKKTGIPLENL